MLTFDTGATVSEPPVEGQQKQFNGSCIVAKAKSRDEVLEELRKDIYAKEEVWNLDKVSLTGEHGHLRVGLTRLV